MKAFSILLVAAAFAVDVRAAEKTTLTVSAAISLKGTLEAVAKQYAAEEPDVQVQFNFGASGALEKQLENGAPVDVFVSAGVREMNTLEQKKLLETGTRKDLLANSLVLIVPKENKSVKAVDDLKSQSVKRIAIGNPTTVPAGNYATQAIAALKLTEAVESKLVRGENVRQVLTYVETQNVEAGFVYGTDAQSSGKVRVVTVLPESSHEPITYPAAVLARAPHPEVAKKFFHYLQGKDATQIFEKAGFTVPAAVHRLEGF